MINYYLPTYLLRRGERGESDSILGEAGRKKCVVVVVAWRGWRRWSVCWGNLLPPLHRTHPLLLGGVCWKTGGWVGYPFLAPFFREKKVWARTCGRMGLAALAFAPMAQKVPRWWWFLSRSEKCANFCSTASSTYSKTLGLQLLKEDLRH